MNEARTLAIYTETILVSPEVLKVSFHRGYGHHTHRPLSGLDWIYSAITQRDKLLSKAATNFSSEWSFWLCHLEYLGKPCNKNYLTHSSIIVLKVLSCLWREDKKQRSFPRWNKMKEAVHLTLLGGDGAQLLLKIWGRHSLRDLGEILYLSEGLHCSEGLMLNPRMLWGGIKHTS